MGFILIVVNIVKNL